MLVHNCLVGTGLRPRIPPRRLRQGGQRRRHRQTDHSGCRLHPVCPHHDVCDRLHSGDEVPHQQVPHRRGHSGQGLARALYVPDKIDRVANYQRATVSSAGQVIASMGLTCFDELQPSMLESPHRGPADKHVCRYLRVADARRTAPGSAAGIVAVGLDRSVVRRVSLKRVIRPGGQRERPVHQPPAGDSTGKHRRQHAETHGRHDHRVGADEDQVAEHRCDSQQEIAARSPSGRAAEPGSPRPCPASAQPRARRS